MKINLEREIKVVVPDGDGEYKDYYLQEIENVDGTKVTSYKLNRDHHYFYANNLVLRRSVQICTPQTPQFTEITELDQIVADLYSGRSADEQLKGWEKIRYSMFGTDRYIHDFSLIIDKLEEDDKIEHCTVTGFPKYTSDDPILSKFEHKDYILIRIALSGSRFEKFAELIKAHNDITLTLELWFPDGFYSLTRVFNPEPERYIKILTKYHDITIPEGKAARILTTLGEVMDFRLGISQNYQRDRYLSQTKAEPIQQQEDDELEAALPSLKYEDNILETLIRNEYSMTQLRTQLWLIFSLLLFISLKIIF